MEEATEQTRGLAKSFPYVYSLYIEYKAVTIKQFDSAPFSNSSASLHRGACVLRNEAKPEQFIDLL
jgi:hypothetical protein